MTYLQRTAFSLSVRRKILRSPPGETVELILKKWGQLSKAIEKGDITQPIGKIIKSVPNMVPGPALDAIRAERKAMAEEILAKIDSGEAQRKVGA